MDIEEVLELADHLIFTKTGKHLVHLQQAILRGTIQNCTYSEIAEDHYASESHVKWVGSELWKIISEELGETVKKSNFRAIFEKGRIYKNHQSAIVKNITGENVTVNNHLNVSCKTERAKAQQQNESNLNDPQTTLNQPHIDLNDAPKITKFYDRTQELSTLEKWMIEDGVQLITLLGLSGIGKTTLSLHLIDGIKTNFDYIIYRSLSFAPTLDETLTNLLEIFCNQDKIEIPLKLETKLSQLFNYLRQYRCLIILDDIQMLFCQGQFAGHYQSGYDNYQLFYKKIAEVCHQSCVILNSWEKPREIEKIEFENRPVRTLILGSLSLAAQDIFRDKNLSNPETWDILINTYQGNPLWLGMIATLIQELFNSRVIEFLYYDEPILCDSLQEQLKLHFQRLSPQEKTVITVLSNSPESLNLQSVLTQTKLSNSELLNTIQSLIRRFLVVREEKDNMTFFIVNPLLKEYVKRV
ncbi:ATPase [Planktothrix agardhii CCAP 1459/11A]|uniref:ATPase n=1 Tax=Planktothrix agardhii CCAP 1459/11A TaxID=282420 RepID=A0A4P5ZG30_PLAAG|nr:NB-ARC domain-containing protein [Planktothrix agardhii]GDZ95038.1 ATPase [Planktothrix agardhii CCAP 1459/11A]